MSQPDPNLFSPENRKAFTEQVEEFIAAHKEFVDTQQAVAKAQIELHRGVIAYAERLMLIDLGTISISVTALLTLAGKFQSNPAAKILFIRYVAPAWVCLLLSAIAFRNMITLLLKSANLVHASWSKKAVHFSVQKTARTIKLMATNFPGQLDVAKEGNAKMLNDVMDSVFNELKPDNPDPIAQAAKVSITASRTSRVGQLFMSVGFILLCYASIRFFLKL